MDNVNSILILILAAVNSCFCENLMRLDTSNFKYKCNDYHDRLTININFVANSTNSSLYMLKYQSSDMPTSSNFTSFHAQNNTLKVIIDSYYSYKLIIQAVGEPEPICNFGFIRFGHCDITEIIIRQSACEIFVEPYKKFSIIPYIYLTVGILLAITIILKFGKKFFIRYSHV